MQPGARVGQFEVLAAIGKGGMGDVWKARDLRLQRAVALKTLSPDVARDPDRIARLEREATLLAAVSHPNIAVIHGIEEHEHERFLVLELVEGPTLADRLLRGPLALREALEIAVQIARAIEAAHARGVVHRDLKPANIKLARNGHVKVLDFGIAKDLGSSPPGARTGTMLRTDVGTVVGTLAYMSPEQMRGETVGRQTDIWSFGVVLFEMLAGTVPFAGPSSADTIARVLEKEPDFGELPDSTPATVQNLLRRCLDKDLRRRAQHIGDVRIELEDWLARSAHDGVELGGRYAGSGRAASKRTTVRLAWIVASVAIVATALLAWMRAYTSAEGRSAAAAAHAASSSVRQDDLPSIAVLPFVNMSADAEQEYFSDGLSEELINHLAHIEGLRVTARTSAFAFKGRSEDLRSVGEALNVAHILDGSVRKSAGRIRVTVQLIDVATGYHVWSESYDSTLSDVFAIQDEIADAVVAKLGPTLGLTQRAVDYAGTKSFEAYDALLRGETAFAERTIDGWFAAAESYRRALELDPAYARASAELAIALSAVLPSQSGEAHERMAAERDEATRRASERAPNAPLSLVAQMWVHSDRREWLPADEACSAAFAGPREPRADWICGGFLTVTGRVRAGLPYREQARAADPLSMNVANTLVHQYSMLGMGDELRHEYERTAALSGSRWTADESMLAYLMQQRAPGDEIVDVMERACARPGAPPARACAAMLDVVRAPEKARPILQELRDSTRGYPSIEVVSIALLAAYVGDRDLALDALEILTRPGSGSATYQNVWYPLLSDARKDPRFKAIVRDVGWVKLWRATGRWSDFCRPLGDDDFECF
jgi:TolB-like protein